MDSIKVLTTANAGVVNALCEFLVAENFLPPDAAELVAARLRDRFASQAECYYAVLVEEASLANLEVARGPFRLTEWEACRDAVYYVLRILAENPSLAASWFYRSGDLAAPSYVQTLVANPPAEDDGDGWLAVHYHLRNWVNLWGARVARVAAPYALNPTWPTVPTQTDAIAALHKFHAALLSRSDFFDLNADGAVTGEDASGEVRRCQECGETCRVDPSGVSNHLDGDGEIDYDADDNHVAIPEVEDD